MFSRYACPNCTADLKANPPRPVKHPWYKFVPRHMLQCASCEAELKKRFASFDMGLASILTFGGAVSIWGAGKIVLPLIAVLFVMRLVVSRFLSVYVLRGC